MRLLRRVRGLLRGLCGLLRIARLLRIAGLLWPGRLLLRRHVRRRRGILGRRSGGQRVLRRRRRRSRGGGLGGLFGAIGAIRIRRRNFTPALRANPREHLLASTLLYRLGPIEFRQRNTCGRPPLGHAERSGTPPAHTWCTNSTRRCALALRRLPEAAFGFPPSDR